MLLNNPMPAQQHYDWRAATVLEPLASNACAGVIFF